MDKSIMETISFRVDKMYQVFDELERIASYAQIIKVEIIPTSLQRSHITNHLELNDSITAIVYTVPPDHNVPDIDEFGDN